MIEFAIREASKRIEGAGCAIALAIVMLACAILVTG